MKWLDLNELSCLLGDFYLGPPKIDPPPTFSHPPDPLLPPGSLIISHNNDTGQLYPERPDLPGLINFGKYSFSQKIDKKIFIQVEGCRDQFESQSKYVKFVNLSGDTGDR